MAEPIVHPPARSFHPRRRQISPTRQALLERVGTAIRLEVSGPMLDLAATFGRSAPVVLDIGFGGGEALVALAAVERDVDVIGVEVHTPGHARVCQAVDTDRLVNVRLVDGDVLDFLPRLPVASLSGVRIWFPDPWPKARQRRRRIVRPDVVDVLVDRLADNGVLHLATDIDDYAEQMLDVCSSFAELAGGRVERPGWRPVTRYEERGVQAGRCATDLMFTRRPR